jgi:tetratricopeptide (TPR) repeat protein
VQHDALREALLFQEGTPIHESDASRERIKNELLGKFKLEGGSRAIDRANLAAVYQRLGDYGNAGKEYQAALEELKAVGDQRLESYVLFQLGVIHNAQGDYERARAYYEQSLAIAYKLEDLNHVASILYELGRLYLNQGNYERARECYEQTQAIAEKLGEPKVVVKADEVQEQ